MLLAAYDLFYIISVGWNVLDFLTRRGACGEYYREASRTGSPEGGRSS